MNPDRQNNFLVVSGAPHNARPVVASYHPSLSTGKEPHAHLTLTGTVSF